MAKCNKDFYVKGNKTMSSTKISMLGMTLSSWLAFIFSYGLPIYIVVTRQTDNYVFTLRTWEKTVCGIHTRA